jgi:hypothetical protein
MRLVRLFTEKPDTSKLFYINNMYRMLTISYKQFLTYVEIVCSVNDYHSVRNTYCIRVFNTGIQSYQILSLGAAWEMGLVKNHTELIENEYNNESSWLNPKEWCQSTKVDHSSCQCCMQVHIKQTVMPETLLMIIIKNVAETYKESADIMEFLLKEHCDLVSADCWTWMTSAEFTKNEICPCCDPAFKVDMAGTEYRVCQNLGLFRLIPENLLGIKTRVEMAQNQRTLLKKFAAAKVVFDTHEYKARESAIRAANPAIEPEGPWCPALCVGGSRRSNSDVKWTPEMRPSCCVYDSIPCKNGYCKDHMHGDKFVHKFPIRNKCCGINPEKNYSSIFSSFVADVADITMFEVPAKEKPKEAVGVPMAKLDESPFEFVLWEDMMLGMEKAAPAAGGGAGGGAGASGLRWR